MMKKPTIEKQPYETPQLEVWNARVEHGFSGSSETSVSGTSNLDNSYTDNGGDAWDGSSGGGGSLGGWFDNGGEPWT